MTLRCPVVHVPGIDLIDYVLVSDGLTSEITGFEIMEDGVCISDHWPVVVSTNISIDSGYNMKGGQTVQDTVPRTKRLCWSKATGLDLEAYQLCLEMELYNLDIPAEAAMCNDPDRCCHKPQIQNYYDQIQRALVRSASGCIRRRKGSKKVNKVWWDSELSKLKSTAQRCFNLWSQSGKPLDGEEYKAMRESRKEFKHKVKQKRCLEREVFCDRLAEESSDRNTANFWRMVRNGIRPTSTTMKGSCKIGEANSDEDVLRLWKRHFGAIINSGSSEDLERDRVIFQDLIETSERNSKWPWWSVEISPSEVESAIRHLKMNKSAGPDGIESEHLRFGGYDLSIHMSIAFTAFLRHAFVPSQFLGSYIVPIIKDKEGNLSNPDNYRGIAISSVVSKVLEHVILDKFGKCLSSSVHQFGFKRNHSCSDCSFVLRESVNYYLQNGNNALYTCALDLSKAYDRIKYYRLFCKLLQKGVPVVVVKLLATWYSSQRMQIKWRNSTSEAFGVTNGVRQGSVLSLCLFNIYIDDLLNQLCESGDGARVANLYVGCLAYADDLALLSPTVMALQRMIDKCSDFAKVNGLIFNVDKSAVITFVKSRFVSVVDPQLVINGVMLPWKSRVTHLGVILDRLFNDTVAVESRIRKYFGAVNAVVSRLGGKVSSDKSWMRIVDVQLFPVLSYGSHMWNMGSASNVRMLNAAFREGVRRGLGMKPRESIRERFKDCFKEASEKIRRLQLLFVKRAVHSKNLLVQGLSWLFYRHSPRCVCRDLVERNLFAVSYRDLKSMQLCL